MIYTRQILIRMILVIKLNFVLGNSSTKVANPMDWTVVETLAEQHPYVVGLLNITKDYMCTGIIIDRRTVLTSGSCLNSALYYIAVGSAVLSKSINKKSLFKISNTLLHGDYIFELKAPDPNVTRMHSNIGLVFSAKPELDAYIPGADLGNYYAPELQDKNLKVVGYGKINETNLAVLQLQHYHQSPCTNPKWYYCVCGYEHTVPKRNVEYEFGEGAPVFLNAEVVGVAAAPCGSLVIKNTKMPYNIFTVLGPYLPWIDKRNYNFTLHLRARSDAANLKVNFICLLLALAKVLFH